MRKPAYFVVYETIKKWIFSGQYKPGDLLPSEPDLIKQFAVSRTTVRKAMEMLAHDSLIVARQGIGTIVLDCHTTQNLNTVTSFTTTPRMLRSLRRTSCLQNLSAYRSVHSLR